MATDAELAEAYNASLTKEQPHLTPQDVAEFPWLRREGDPAPSQTEQPQLSAQDLADFPWLARQETQPQAQAKTGVDPEFIKAATDAYNKTRSPLEWAEDVIKGSPLSFGAKVAENLPGSLAKRVLETPTGIAAEAARLASHPVEAGGEAAAGMATGMQIPNLQGLSVDQVKALREQMIAQSNDLSKRQDQIINSGSPDEYGLYGYLQAKQGIDQRIKDADAIIASGKPQAGPSSPTEPIAESLSYGGRHMTPALSGFLDKYIPTDQEFENSVVGTLAKGGADAAVLAGYSLLGGPITGQVAGAMMFGNQAYDDAKAHGASDEVADRASLFTALASGSTLAVTGPIIGALGKSFAGLSAKAGMSAIQQAMVYGGTKVLGGGIEFGAINMEQNEIARLTGYDPNRKQDLAFWNNFWTGVAYSTIHLATADMPHIQRLMKPDVTVRNKDATPAQTGEQTQAPVTPTPLEATTTAPPVTTTPEEQATAAARETVSQTPEQVIAQADPEAELHRFIAMEGQAEPTTAPQPTTTAEEGERVTPAVLGDIGKGITKSLQNMLWEKVQRGETTEAGAPSNLLIEAAREKAAGRLNTRADFDALYQAYGERLTAQTQPTRDAAAMPPAATEHGAEPVPSNTPGPATTVEAPKGTEGTDVLAGLSANIGFINEKGVSTNANLRQLPDGRWAIRGDLVGKGDTTYGTAEEAVAALNAAMERGGYQYQRMSGGYHQGANVEEARYPLSEDQRQTLEGLLKPEAAPEEEHYWSPEEEIAAKSSSLQEVQAKIKAGFDQRRADLENQRAGMDPEEYRQQLQHINRQQVTSLENGRIQWEQKQYRAAHPLPEEETTQRPAWYEKEDLANLPPEARPEPEDRTIGPADVKKEVNDAQEQMGMEDHLHYVASVEALPDHVKAGLTEGERGNTAQIVRDNKLGDIYVIGDRFDSLNDLRRKIIEETLPYHYRNITKVGLTHDNTDPRTGHYDVLSDRPVLNTHAIISQDRPYEEASRALMEEADVHQGISKLLGPRNGPVYTQVMDQLMQNFRRLGLVDKLAQLRGYENAQHMAQAYGTPKWETDPRQGNKFTEELAAGYSRNFRNADELMRDGPSWWQNGLRRMNNSIRQFMGLRLSDYDVQSLLVDSAAALRRAKWDDHESQFHPIGEEAKGDMREFQMASLPPEKTATEAGETADIGTELVKAQARKLQRNLRPGQFVREQNLARAMDNTHSLQERLNLLRSNDAVENEEGHREVMQQANRVFREDFNGNVDLALQHLIDDEARPLKAGAAVPALNEVVDRNTDRRIEELRTAGLHDEANLLAARLDRMEQIQGRRTTEVARELSAERLRHETGTKAVARSKNDTQDSQQHEIEKPTQVNNKRKIDEGLDKVKEATEAAAGSLRDKVKKAVAAKPAKPKEAKPAEEKPTYRRIGPGWGLREQHVQDLVDRIDDAVSKGGDVQDKGGLAQVYDSFRKTLLQIIRERRPPEERETQPISPMSTLRDIMSNYPAYEEAWKRTMDMLQAKDPALAQRFSSAIEEPVGETLANKLAGEQGVDLSDLIYNHYSTTDRLNADLASKIAQAATEGRLGPGQEWLSNLQNAQGLANRLQTLFKDIVNKEQGAKLQSILDSIGATHKPTPKELDQLLNHIAIGGLDSAEWLNLVGPRFGIEGYTPEKLDALRAAGDYMMRLRDEGLDNSAIAQKTRAQIAQLTQLNDDPWLTKQFKYLNDVYASGLLTGPMTHMPYWQQGLMTNATDTLVQGIRAAMKAKDPNILLAMWPKAMAGYARGWGEFGTVFRGIKPSETFFPEGTYRPPGPMEATPERLLSKFRYVRNFLEAVSNLMVKGPAYAVHYANMRYLLEEKGLSPEAAHEAASEVVLGSKEARDRAIRDAKDVTERYGLDADQHKMLQAELLDQYKTTRDPADSSLANTTTEELRDVATRAYDTGMGGSLRGEVRGSLGFISRGLLSFANKHPFFRPIAEFLKVPFNAINEFMAWTPLGITRSARNLVPADTPLIGRAITELPFTKGGIESYVGKVPGMAKKIETGEFSQEHIRDIAWNQMAKGFVGSTVASFLFGVVRSLLNNPNPPIQFSFQGPSQYGQQEIERGKGWQPRSIKIGGAWHSYENTPWRMLFSALGAYEDYFRYEKQSPDTFSNEALAAYRGLAGGVTSAFGSPLQGLDALLNYFTQFGGQGAQREVGNFATQLVGSLLSTPLGGTAARQLYRTFVDQTEYEGNNIWEKSLRYVPVVNSLTLQPKLNVFGEHMHSTPLKAFPEYGNQVDPNDPVWNYLSTHPHIQLSMPGNQGSVAGIKMTPDEIYQYHLARGPVLKEQLARAFESSSFQTMPPAIQNDIIKRVYEKVASRAGQMAVMRYRQEHPVTQERIEQTPRGQIQAALRQEAESTRLPEEQSE